MSMTDPVADMLTRLRNANAAFHETVSMPSSKMKMRIAKILKTQGYISSVKERTTKNGLVLTLELKYSNNRKRAIVGIRRISKPGLRVYVNSNNLPRVLGGLGIAILSTSSGLLTNREAYKKGIGGEVVAYIW